MLTHLLVMMDKGAPSFCHYRHGCREGELMPLPTLERAVDFAKARGLALTMLLGREALPPEYEAALAKVAHAKIGPALLAARYPDAVLVWDAGRDEPDGEVAGGKRHVVVTLPKDRLTELAAVVEARLGSCTRLELCLGNVDEYAEGDIGEYGRQLEMVASMVSARYMRGELPEVNIISDRMLLKAMNNCGAGVTHLTVAPNGKLYICPGFYYDDEQDTAGSLADGVSMRNGQLLRLENAPICSRCDAYHCRRCVYLNAKTTLERNTPSRQQCVLAHVERNAARMVQERLRALTPFSLQAPIPAIDYFDPFTLISEGGGNE